MPATIQRPSDFQILEACNRGAGLSAIARKFGMTLDEVKEARDRALAARVADESDFMEAERSRHQYVRVEWVGNDGVHGDLILQTVVIESTYGLSANQIEWALRQAMGTVDEEEEDAA